MHNRLPAILLFLTGLLAMALITLLLPGAPAGAADLPPRPTAAPTPTATPLPVDDDGGDVAPPQGATITLVVENPPATAWTVVQWQDAFGDWHDVSGWRGRLDDGDGREKIWWVAPKDFDTGPFRWLVYEQRDGEVVATSDSFTLPERARASLLIPVTVPE